MNKTPDTFSRARKKMIKRNIALFTAGTILFTISYILIFQLMNSQIGSPSVATNRNSFVPTTTKLLITNPVEQGSKSLSEPILTFAAQESSPTPLITPVPSMSFSGTGDGVINLPEPLIHVFGRINNQGKGNFIVSTYDQQNEKLDLIVNEIGNYQGVKPLALEDDKIISTIEIKSEGDWSIEVFHITDIQKFTSCKIGTSCTGVGSDVLLIDPYRSEIKNASFANAGKGNFIVESFGSHGLDLIVNEIGNYFGQSIIPGQLVFLFIESDGDWTVKLTSR